MFGSVSIFNRRLLVLLQGGLGSADELWVDQVLPGDPKDVSLGREEAALQSGRSTLLPLPVDRVQPGHAEEGAKGYLRHLLLLHMMAANRQAAQEQVRAGADNAPAGGTVCPRRRGGRSRGRNQQVEVSWTEEVLVQRAELNHYLLMDAQRPAFVTKQQTTVLQLRRRDHEE